jgi:hypothetical protein
LFLFAPQLRELDQIVDEQQASLRGLAAEPAQLVAERVESDRHAHHRAACERVLDRPQQADTERAELDQEAELRGRVELIGQQRGHARVGVGLRAGAGHVRGIVLIYVGVLQHRVDSKGADSRAHISRKIA